MESRSCLLFPFFLCLLFVFLRLMPPSHRRCHSSSCCCSCWCRCRKRRGCGGGFCCCCCCCWRRGWWWWWCCCWCWCSCWCWCFLFLLCALVGRGGDGGNVDDVDVVLHALECLCGRPMAMTIPTVIALTMEMFLSVALLITLLLRRQQYKKKLAFSALRPCIARLLMMARQREREREAQTLKINAKSEQQKATISAIFATLSQRTRQKPRTT